MIIQGGKDFYDTVSQHGIDENVVFNRTNEIVCTNKLNDIIPQNAQKIVGDFFADFDHKRGLGKYDEWASDFSFYTIFIAGKVYNYFCYNENFFENKKPFFVTNEEQLDKFINKFNLSGFVDGNYFYDKKNKFNLGELKKLVETKEDYLNDFLIEQNATIFTFEKTYGDFVSNPIWTKNGFLKEKYFDKILDPYSVYQNIQQWQSFIAQPEKEISEIPDKYKILKHGFDDNSFRTRKI